MSADIASEQDRRRALGPCVRPRWSYGVNVPKQDRAAASLRSRAPNLGQTARVLLAIALNVLLSATSSSAPLQAPAGGDQSQLKGAQALIKAVYATVRGRLDPSGQPLGWFHAFFKGENGNTYIPYTVTIPRSAVPGSTIAMYVFVTPHLGPGQGGSRQRPDDPEPAEPQAPAGPETAFQAIYFLDAGTHRAPDAYRVSRAFAVPPGSYDVYVAVGDITAAQADAKPSPDGAAANVMVIKQEVSVPDLWRTSLSISTVVVAERVEPLKAPPTVEQQTSNPYLLSGWHIVPARRTEFQHSDELSVIFFVYNAGLTSARKPDVTIEYVFYRRSDARETYFIRTPPQHFNGSTVPSFRAEAGHQIIGGQAVPLKSFPEGVYRLEVKVVDKTNGSTVTRDVAFSVRAS